MCFLFVLDKDKKQGKKQKSIKARITCGPYNSGEFGRLMQEALIELRSTVTHEHPLIKQFIQFVCRDFGLDPRESHADKELWDMVLAKELWDPWPHVVKHALHSKMCPLRVISQNCLRQLWRMPRCGHILL